MKIRSLRHAAAGVTPVTKTPFLDVISLVTTLDPSAKFFSYDKTEGVAALDGGRYVVLSNDSDFGIDGRAGTAAPFTLHAKVSRTSGNQDDGEFLTIDTTRPPAAISTATVTIAVR